MSTGPVTPANTKANMNTTKTPTITATATKHNGVRLYTVLVDGKTISVRTTRKTYSFALVARRNLVKHLEDAHDSVEFFTGKLNEERAKAGPYVANYEESLERAKKRLQELTAHGVELSEEFGWLVHSYTNRPEVPGLNDWFVDYQMIALPEAV